MPALESLVNCPAQYIPKGTRSGHYVTNVALAMARMRHFVADVCAIWRGDPALRGKLRMLEVPLYASFWALLFYRIAHALHATAIPWIPRLFSQVARFLTGIEIHPGAVIGPGLFIDHGMAVVVGETAIVGANVTLFHGVTLGAVDGRLGRRHPLLGDGVVVGAGAKILGPVCVGTGARVGAQAVVLSDIPPKSTAVGVPARILKRAPGATVLRRSGVESESERW